MKKYIETRHLTAYELRRICIRNDWYNCGTNEEYENLFARLRSNGGYAHITTEKLAEIAADIMEHSDDMEDWSMTDIMRELAAHCLICIVEA